MPASKYLDGEPAKAVLEIQRSLVSAEGNGILGAQPVKLLLVVDHKNLPENKHTGEASQKHFGRGWGDAGGGHRLAILGLVNNGKRGLCVPPNVGRNVLISASFPSSS